MNTKTNKDNVGYYESAIAIFGKNFTNGKLTSIEINNDFEYGKPLTFQNVLDECLKNGFDNRGTILLILESYLDGKIYRYGNYGDDKWYEVGNMVGFA